MRFLPETAAGELLVPHVCLEFYAGFPVFKIEGGLGHIASRRLAIWLMFDTQVAASVPRLTQLLNQDEQVLPGTGVNGVGRVEC